MTVHRWIWNKLFLWYFCSYFISFLVILDIILRKVIKSSKVCMRLRLPGEWNWRLVFSTEISCSMQKCDISIALGVSYQQTVNSGFLQIKKSYQRAMKWKSKRLSSLLSVRMQTSSMAKFKGYHFYNWCF